jgi:hypothetical protein
LGQAALEGPLVYARETHLVRRVVRKDDTEMALLKRMMGQAPPDPGLREEPASKRTMQRAQYALADRASRGDGVAGVVYRLRARHHLVQRFGIFGDTFLDEALDRLLQRRPIQTSMNRLDRLFTDGRRL